VSCWRIEQDPINQDPINGAFVDCNGGTGAKALLDVNSNTSSAPPDPSYDPLWLTVNTTDPASPAGTAALRVLVKRVMKTATNACPAVTDTSWASVSALRTAMVTEVATTNIHHPHRCGGSISPSSSTTVQCPDRDPYTVTLHGAPFNCSTWTSQPSGKLVSSFVNLEHPIGSPFTDGDISQVLKLAD